jgi:hypothetical protein
MQLLELENQNKKRLIMARQEQDCASSIEIAAHDASALQYPLSHSETEGHSIRLVESESEAEAKRDEVHLDFGNLDFSTLENSDVLEDFDFDSFPNTTNDDTFKFDSAIGIGGDFGVDPDDHQIGGDGSTCEETGRRPVTAPGQSTKDHIRARQKAWDEAREESMVKGTNVCHLPCGIHLPKICIPGYTSVVLTIDSSQEAPEDDSRRLPAK